MRALAVLAAAAAAAETPGLGKDCACNG